MRQDAASIKRGGIVLFGPSSLLGGTAGETEQDSMSPGRHGSFKNAPEALLWRGLMVTLGSNARGLAERMLRIFNNKKVKPFRRQELR